LALDAVKAKDEMLGSKTSLPVMLEAKESKEAQDKP
jgi:hypothetical protein